MHLVSPWAPRFAAGDAPAYERLVAALSEDITNGLLPPGARLPAHRELAFQLKTGLGTVTKAYGVLERRGLVQSVRGRGMFVAGDWMHRGQRGWIDGFHHGGLRPAIDLAINIPPQTLSRRLLTATFALLAKRLDPHDFGQYRPAIGLPAHQMLLARYLAARGLHVPAETLLLCNGAQHALAIAFKIVCQPDGLLFTEALTFPGALALARDMNVTPRPLASDEQGILPQALEEALRSRGESPGPAVLYLIPTTQNPTAITMSLARRRALVNLARTHDLILIEDDVYGIFASPGLPTLAELAPERTLYVTGFSKTLSPGLRIGLITTPPALTAKAVAALQTTSTMAAPISCAILEQWLTDGTAESVEAAIRAEARKRTTLAQSILGHALVPRVPDGFHVWLPMTVAAADRIVHEAAAAGVLLTPAAAFLPDPAARMSGLRLCLGGPDLDDLTQGLKIVKHLLDAPRASVPRFI